MAKTGPSKRGRPTPTNKKLYNSKVAAAKKKFDVSQSRSGGGVRSA